MVARINATAKFSAVLQYNEKKVAQNQAQITYAKELSRDKNRLNLYEKTDRFQRLHDLNHRSLGQYVAHFTQLQPHEKPFQSANDRHRRPVYVGYRP